MHPSFRRLLPAVAAGLLVGFVTLLPAPNSSGVSGSICLICGIRGTADAILNLGLFMPLGMALVRGGWPLGRTLALGAALSTSVEVLQVWIPGRDASLGDVLFNSLGTGLGVLVGATAARWLRPSPSRASWLTVAGGVGGAVAIASLGYAMSYQLPASTYYAQWTPELGHLEVYRGSVTDAGIDSIPLVPPRLARSAEVRSSLLAGELLRVRGVGGPPVTGLAPIFSIYDDEEREIVLLGVNERDVLFRYRTRARDLRLDQPDLRHVNMAGALRDGVPFDLRVRRIGETYCLEVNADAACGLGVTPGAVWTLLYYSDSLPGWTVSLLEIVAIGALFFPLGFWGRRLGPLVGATVVASGALIAVPVLTVLLPAPPSQWLGGAAGMLMGMVVGRFTGRDAVSSPVAPL